MCDSTNYTINMIIWNDLVWTKMCGCNWLVLHSGHLEWPAGRSSVQPRRPILASTQHLWFLSWRMERGSQNQIMRLAVIQRKQPDCTDLHTYDHQTEGNTLLVYYHICFMLQSLLLYTVCYGHQRGMQIITNCAYQCLCKYHYSAFLFYVTI